MKHKEKDEKKLKETKTDPQSKLKAYKRKKKKNVQKFLHFKIKR